MKKLTLVAASVTFALGLVACSHTDGMKGGSQPALVSGITMSNIDSNVSAASDFYRHVNGQWLKTTEIPADKSNYGSFGQLYDESQIKLRNIVERTAAQKNKTFGSDEQKLGDLYTSYMDVDKAEALGYTPIKPELANIANLNDKAMVMTAFAKMNNLSVRTPISWYVNNDAKDSTQYITNLSQSGLGLPDKSYYLKDDEKMVKLRNSYQKHVARVLGMVDYQDAKAAAKSVIDFETALAKVQWSRVESRDPIKSYNKLTAEQMNTMLGNDGWKQYAKNANLEKASHVVVRQLSYFENLNVVLAKTELNAIKAYLSFHLINTYSPSLSKAFVDARFEFYDMKLRGLTEPSPRWKRAINASNGMLGEILGKFYVAENFKPEAKARMEKMVQNLIKAYGKRINSLEWMSDETKKAAQEKLSKFTYKIGYPDKWIDYSALEIKADDLVGNGMRYAKWDNLEQSNLLGKPIDKTKWFMPPQTVNAYYNPVMNEIVFPAAILQPPFFNMEADDAVNYGGIGAVIGHELGHGFDDSGAQYDGDGNLRDWWSASDKSEFEQRGQKFVKQFDQFKPFPDVSVNGQLTLGENIGDLGGLIVSLEAYRLSLDGNVGPIMDGYTGEQRFFMGWAQVWRRKYREETLRQRLVTDSHSPSEYRVNGIMPNIPDFYDAFDVKAGDEMYLAPAERVKIW